MNKLRFFLVVIIFALNASTAGGDDILRKREILDGQVFKAMANLLQNYEQQVVTKTDYNRLLGIYTRSHRKDGKPYLAEALHPDTGSFAGHDTYNHSEHYFHSGYCDLVITGLVGLKPRGDDVIEVDPLAPDNWKYFALDDVVVLTSSLFTEIHPR